MAFKKGESGNPAGRKKGSKNKKPPTAIVEPVLGADAEATYKQNINLLMQDVFRKAFEGDARYASMLINKAEAGLGLTGGEKGIPELKGMSISQLQELAGE